MNTQNFDIVSNIDWLAITYILYDDEEEVVKNLVLDCGSGYRQNKEGETAQWRNRVIVYNSYGIKKLTYLFGSKSPLFSKYYCLIEFANNTLYTNEWRYLLANLNLFVNGYIQGISRLDVCCDCQCYLDENNDICSIEKCVENIYKDVYYIAGKREGVSFFDIIDKDNKKNSFPRQISFGSKTSKVKWKLYNKTQEIMALRKEKGKDSKYKDYIFKMWELIGFDKTKDVWRLECSIRGANSQMLVNEEGKNLISLSELTKDRAITRIFEELTANYFKVKVNEGHKNKNRNKDVLLFRSKSQGFKIVKKEGEERPITDEVKATIRFLQKKVNEGSINYYLPNREKYVRFIADLVRENDLFLWYESTFGTSIYELESSLKVEKSFEKVDLKFEKSFEKVSLFNYK